MMTDTLRDRAFGYGLAVIVAGSAVLSAMFGWSLSKYTIIAAILAAVFAAVCVISAAIWISVRKFWDESRYISAAVAATFGALLLAVDMTSNFGSISWQRGENIQTARVQNTVYEDKRETVKEAKEKLAFFEKHLAELKSKQAWAGTKPPSAFDSQIEAAKLAVNLEAQRGGCGPICERKRFELASLEAQRAMAVRYADLEKQIAATKRILGEARTTAAVTKPGESGALMQNAAIASVFTLSLNPDDTAMGWTERGVAWLVALFLCVAGPLGSYVWKYGSTTVPNPPAARAAPANLLPARDATSLAQAAPAGGNSYQVTVNSDSELRNLLAQLKLAAA